MAIPVSMNRIVIRGTLPQGEFFNTSFWTFGNTPTSDTEAATFASGIRTLIETNLLPNAKLFIGSDSTYEGVNTYHYPSGGPTAAYLGVSDFTTKAGTSTQNGLTLQTAWVATLRTGQPGRSRRGRMYLPCIQRTLAAHQLTSGDLALLTGSLATTFTAINNAIDYGTVVVLSQVGVGSWREVTRVDGDSRLDVQRRRANRETELFQSGVNV